MRKRKLAWLLAMAMTVTSVDGTALAVGAADFSSEEAAGFAAEDPGESAVVQETAGESEQSQDGSDQENASQAEQETEDFGFGDGIDDFVSEEAEFGSEETLQDVDSMDSMDSTEALEAAMAEAVEYPTFHTQLPV